MKRYERFVEEVARLWIEGWRVVFVWLAFHVVLGVLYLPFWWLLDSMGRVFGLAVGIPVFVILVPVMFAGTCRHLRLGLWPRTSDGVCARCKGVIEGDLERIKGAGA